MPFFDGPITRKSETDAADTCPECWHDECSCGCVVCHKHKDNPKAKQCGCVSCRRLRRIG